MKISMNYKYPLVIIIAIFMAGCVDLVEQSGSNISPSNFYQTDTDFNAALNGALGVLYGGYAGFDFVNPTVLSMGADDVGTRENERNLFMYDEFTVTVNLPRTAGLWNTLYNAINASNQIIASIPDAPDITSPNSEFFEGQARYIRALSYFYLTRWWGEVPIITMENQLDAENVGQSSVSDIYNVIVGDLEIAEDFLPNSFQQVGRPTKGSAKALLAEVHLTMAGWPLMEISNYALARDKAKEVMDMQMYDLEENFEDLWVVANSRSNSEFIFSFFGSSSTGGSASHLHVASRPSEEGGWNDFMSEPRFISTFPEGPRKDASFHTVFYDEGNTTWQNSTIGKPYIAKWRDAGDGARADGPVMNNDGSGFFPINRYAEVLLTYAEAANMAEGGPSAEAYEAINEVRRRAGGNDQDVYGDLPLGLSQQEFDEAVINERAWELAFEVKRWFDLVRRELVVQVNQDTYPNVREHHKWLPKPQSQVDLINGLEQNPGYN